MIIKLQNSSIVKGIKQRIYQSQVLNSKEDVISPNRKCFSAEDKMNIVVEGQSENITISEICLREDITPAIFYQWTQDFLESNSLKNDIIVPAASEISEDEKYKIVIEGKSGETSIAEICRKKHITHDTFLDWSKSFLDFRNNDLQNRKLKNPIYQKSKKLISNVVNLEVFNYFENYIDFSINKSLVVLKPNSNSLDEGKSFENIVSMHKINDVRFINKYFEKINSKLEKGGVFIGCVETFSSRRKRMKINKIPFLNNVYFSFEFIFKRILPKVSFSKKYYFDFTKGNDRLLSKAESLGRLVSCGFKIMDYKSINGILYFVVKKSSKPRFDLNPSYGPLYKMPRLGKNGKIIGVYKFRTMHPYSEYLQDYIVNANGYSETGKPANDFRIPKWGRFLRRYWLDELPQMINVLKGEIKLVGVRPVSIRYFQDIPKEMQKLRLTQKPGCIPPYVALNRDGNVMSVLNAEKEYLEEKIKHPYSTDTKYFIKAIINILFKHKRSA